MYVGDEMFKRNKKRINGRHSENLQEISGNISEEKQALDTIFYQIPDLITREIDQRLLLAYIDGLTDEKMLSNQVIQPLLDKISPGEMCSEIHTILTVSNISLASTWEEVEDELLHGSSILFVEGEKKAYVMKLPGWKERDIQEPENEATLLGSHQGFTENSQTSIALIRRYLPDKELKIVEQSVGIRGKTKTSILYLRDVAKPEIVDELQNRVKKIQIDAMINTGEIQEFVEDNSFTLFPQFMTTERPDTAASELLQGRVVLVFDRSPSVLIGPFTLASFFHTADDYSIRWLAATFIRLLRYAAFIIAIFLPALYIATISFHFEMLPLHLIITVGESRATVPLNPIMEAFFMEITIEMLREAGLRLPSRVGQTVGVVGGIIIGQAAVQAGLVSNIMVIIVSITAIASFMLPHQDFSSGVRLIRFPTMFLAAFFGMFGIMISVMILIAHLVALESLGTPYGAPYAPTRFSDWKDSFIRVPSFWMKQRPLQNQPQELNRQGSGDKQS